MESLADPSVASLIGSACFHCGKMQVEAGADRLDMRSATSPLRRCGGCKRAWFCDNDCQMAAWRSGAHRRACKQLAKVPMDLCPAVSSSAQSWAKHVAEASIVMTGKGIPPDAIHLALANQRHCMSCNATGDDLLPCQRCLWDYRCPAHVVAAADDHTELECNEFVRLNTMLAFEQSAVVRGNPGAQLTADALIGQARSKMPGSWEEFWEWRFSEAMRGMQSGLLLVMATKQMTTSLTTLMAMEHFNVIGRNRSIVIHIIGAGLHELDRFRLQHWEEILHQRSPIRHLSLVFIGPDVGCIFAPDSIGVKRAGNCCPTCASAGRTRSFTPITSTYQRYCRSSSFEAPDLAIAFNSGIGEDRDWDGAIRAILDINVPFCHTSRTSEGAREASSRIEQLGGRPTITCQLNPFYSLEPHVDFFSDARIVYNNRYVGFARPGGHEA